MDEDRFQWDAEKAAANERKQGVTFERAIKVFPDVFAIEEIDHREGYGEERMNVLGMSDGTILHVTCAERGNFIRLISARRAKKHERDHYYRENSR